MKLKRTPKEGMKILENLHKKFPNNQWVKENLINTYIELGYHDLAIHLIKNGDKKNLRHQAWLCHKENNIDEEKYIWSKIYKRIYKPEILPLLGSLIKISRNKINISKDDICLFCVERNEILCLPFLLKYYRKIGITRFFFVDNNSNDGSIEFLLKNPDCHIFWTNNSHSEAGGGMNWINHLIDTYITENQWYIVADADEFLIYPNYESVKIDKLIEYLNQYKYEAVSSFMIDMFPKNLKQQLDIKSGDNLLKSCPYFYNHYEFYHSIESSYLSVFGGIFAYLLPYQKDWLYKTLLMKKGIKPITSNHRTTSAKVADITSALFHFKFKGNFELTAQQEAKRKIHNNGGLRYRKYAQLFQDKINNNFDFTQLDKTTKYQNSQQLVELGLIKTSEEWEKFCATQ